MVQLNTGAVSGKLCLEKRSGLGKVNQVVEVLRAMVIMGKKVKGDGSEVNGSRSLEHKGHTLEGIILIR